MAKKVCKRYLCRLQTKDSYNDKKSFKEKLKEIVKNYFKGLYGKDLSVFEEVSQRFRVEELNATESKTLQKFLLVFFLGHLLDLPTLHSMLEAVWVKSNSASKKYEELQKYLSINSALKLYEKVFEQQLKEKLCSLCSKHSCIFSRELVTVVLDDSVFKQWLSRAPSKSK